MAGRTMTIIHKGDRLVIAEGQAGEVEFRMGKHRAFPKAKSFNAACKEGVAYMLKSSGDMKGDYER
jgi:hypothetical protein